MGLALSVQRAQQIWIMFVPRRQVTKTLQTLTHKSRVQLAYHLLLLAIADVFFDLGKRIVELFRWSALYIIVVGCSCARDGDLEIE